MSDSRADREQAIRSLGLENQLPRVEQLPEELANQIAAGEVVERPASVVRELVENSIDAGATRIHVELREGGVELIRVTDNGCGMERRDAELAIRRHATSKLKRREDLFRIATMGFRGEAIPSIASVSRFSLVTKPHDTLGGTRILVEGGNVRIVEDYGCPPGTDITVEELFFNTPARKKFMKTRSTEVRHVVETVQRLALPRPGIAFTLVHNDRTVVDLPAVNDVAERLFGVVGREDAEQMFACTEAEQDGVVATGFIGAPSVTRRTTAGIWTFINGRFVRDSTLLAAIKVAYRGLVDRGRHPVVAIFLDVPVSEVDVNVHPAKVEVRFKNPNAVFRAARRTIVQTLADTPWVPSDHQGERVPHGEAAEGEFTVPSTAERVYELDRGKTRAEFHEGGTGEIPGLGAGHRSERQGESHLAGDPGGARVPSGSDDGDSLDDVLKRGGRGPAGEEVPPEGYFSNLWYVGQIHGTYLLCSDRQGLVVIDMHAAHERITFERLREAWSAKQIETQPMLVPQMLSLDSLRAAAASEHIEFFSRLGFEIEPFGGNDFALKETPAVLSGARFGALITDTLDELAEHGTSERIKESVDSILIRMACHGSLRSGDTITADEAHALFAQLDEASFGANCPHGRPVYFRMSVHELESRFDRR